MCGNWCGRLKNERGAVGPLNSSYVPISRARSILDVPKEQLFVGLREKFRMKKAVVDKFSTTTTSLFVSSSSVNQPVLLYTCRLRLYRFSTWNKSCPRTWIFASGDVRQ